MSYVVTDNKYYAEIAAAIREKLGSSVLYKPSEMAAAISEITGGGGRLPSGYTELEYIESTGTQYVDTGFVPNQDTRVVATFETENCNSNWRCVFGARTTTGNAQSLGFYLSNTNVFSGFYGNSNNKSFTFSGISVSGKHTVDWNKNVVTLDGVTQTLTAQTYDSTCSLYICNVNTAGTLGAHPLQGKIYSCQIYDNGTLVREFVPCRNPYGIVGLYDLVNGQFYGNAGTGEFTGMPIRALPAGYTKLDYIQSSGTQYVDTLFKPNQDTRIVVDAYNDSSSTAWAYGAWNGNNSAMFGLLPTGVYYGSTTASVTAFSVGAVKVDHNKNAYAINGKTGTILSQTFSCNHSLYLFALNAAGGVSSGKFYGKLYSCQIYDNGIMVRDYIPCINPSGAYGLYDMVNAQFYGNAGSGSFTGA